MRVNWKKVCVSIFVLVSLAVTMELIYQQVISDRKFANEQTQRQIDVINFKKFMSELDCDKPTSETDKIICANESLKLLDKQLEIAYHNNSLWRWTGARKHDDELCKKDCLINLDSLQQRWLSEIRNRCISIKCFTKAYTDRITELNGQSEPLPTFKLTTYKAPAMCNELLVVLNQAPREQLGVCSRYNFSGTAFTQETVKLGLEHWQAFEELYYKNYPQRLAFHDKAAVQRPSFTELWSALEQRYRSGARELYGVQHKNSDAIVAENLPQEARFASYDCQVIPYGAFTERMRFRVKRHDEFKKLDEARELKHARQYGWQSIVVMPNAGKAASVQAGQLLGYGGEWYVLNQQGMSSRNGREGEMFKPYVSLIKITQDKKPVSEHSNVCSYWYNY